MTRIVGARRRPYPYEPFTGRWRSHTMGDRVPCVGVFLGTVVFTLESLARGELCVPRTCCEPPRSALPENDDINLEVQPWFKQRPNNIGVF